MARPWLAPPDIAVPAALAAAVGGHPLVAQTLARRGVMTPAAAVAFLDPGRVHPDPAGGAAGHGAGGQPAVARHPRRRTDLRVGRF